MRIGIDALGMQHPCFKRRGIGRYAENFVGALRRFDRVNDYVVYFHDGYPPEKKPWNERAEPDSSQGAWRISHVPHTEHIAYENPDGLDVLLLTVPFCEKLVPRHPHRGCQMASIIYDLIPFLYPERNFFDVRTGGHYYESLQRLKRYDALLTISESAKSDCESVLGLPSGRAVNIGCASRENYFRPCPDREGDHEGRHILNRLGVTGPYLFNIGDGDFLPRKNVEGLVRAFGMLPARLVESRQLVVACKMSEEKSDRLRRVAAESGCAARLVLTNVIPDEALRALYQHCDLFAFPSEYEGFGLPILEAMQCGAPVLVGDNSSQPEVVGSAGILVNVADDVLLADRMRQVLDDAGLRAELGRRGLVQAARFRWEDIARRTVAVCEQLAARVPAGRTNAGGPSGNLPRLALFAPVPPKQSASADYSRELLSELKNHFRIDLYHDAGYVPELKLSGADFRAYDYRLFPARASAFHYRGVLYLMGNRYSQHQFIYDSLRQWPGLVVLHDFFLGDFHFESARDRFRPGQLDSEVRHAVPAPVADQLLDNLDRNNGRLAFTDGLRQRGLFMNERIFDSAETVIVHSPWWIEIARRTNPAWAEKLSVVPFGVTGRGAAPPAERERIRKRFALPGEALLVGSFGAVEPAKLNREAVAAFRSLAQADPQALFVFVGQAPADWHAWAAQLGLTGRIRALGRVSLDDFRALAGVMDIGVNLRRPGADGHPSASLFTLLGAGVPTLVTDVDVYSVLPDNVVVKIPWREDFAARLGRELLELARDRGRRDRLGEAALRHLREFHGWSRVAAQYAEIIHKQTSRTISSSSATALRMTG